MDEYLDNLVKDLSSILNNEEYSSMIDAAEEVDDQEEFKIYPPIRSNYSNIGDYGVVNPKHPSGHQGVDLRASAGTEVYSVAQGKVTHCGTNEKGGLTVSIHHSNNFKSYYAHLQSISCKVGEEVTKDSVIGTVGNSGNAKGTSPHLHFQLWENNQIVNPAKYFYVPKYSLKDPNAISNAAKIIKSASQIDVPSDILKTIGILCKEFVGKIWKDELGYHFDKLNPVFKARINKSQSETNLIKHKNSYVSWIDFNPNDSRYSEYFNKSLNKLKLQDKEIIDEINTPEIKQVLEMYFDQYYDYAFSNIKVSMQFEFESKEYQDYVGSSGNFYNDKNIIVSRLLLSPDLDLTDEKVYEKALLEVINTAVHEFMHFIQFTINSLHKPSPIKAYFKRINYFDKTSDIDGFITFFESIENAEAANPRNIKNEHFKLFGPKSKLDDSSSKMHSKHHKEYLNKIQSDIKEIKQLLSGEKDPSKREDLLKLLKTFEKLKNEKPGPTDLLHQLNTAEFFPQMFTESVLLASYLKKIPMQFRNIAIKLYFGAINYLTAVNFLNTKNKEFPSLNWRDNFVEIEGIAKKDNEIKSIKKYDLKRWQEACSRVYSSLTEQGLV